ncbi:hypothetical protein TELCIR_06218 [Teladorsagia circumcincta]|uniref:Uncharacterized protein n=1 Tax=Teladorsagia circumcincta TaxID=45464 RepID=A0A2G9UQX6_TELCI|nr:hypothetical protein TELCIR_06218 [Teladorsagia circumcincta]
MCCAIVPGKSSHSNNELPQKQANRCQSKEELNDYKEIEETFKHRCDTIISSVLQKTAELTNTSDMGVNTVHDRFEDAIRYAEYQLKLAEIENNELLKAEAWFNLGSLYHSRAREMLQKMNLALPQDEKADHSTISEVENSIDNNMTKALSCYCLSDLNPLNFLVQSFSTLAKARTQNRLKAARRFNDNKGEYRALQNIGNEYASLSQFDKAVKLYNEAKQVAIRMADVPREERCQHFIKRISQLAAEQAEAAIDT